jgi:hypothetical protein
MMGASKRCKKFAVTRANGTCSDPDYTPTEPRFVNTSAFIASYRARPVNLAAVRADLRDLSQCLSHHNGSSCQPSATDVRLICPSNARGPFFLRT